MKKLCSVPLMCWSGKLTSQLNLRVGRKKNELHNQR
jgi:hypothetical protein